MPNRCYVCNFITSDEENKECTQREKCVFQEVAMIHLTHPKGTGVLLGKEVCHIGEGEGEEKTLALTNVYLFCDTDNVNPISTSIVDNVTCLTCLSNFNKSKEV